MDTDHRSSAAADGPVYAGIDVAQDKLDLCCDEAGAVEVFANDPAGIAAIVKRLGPRKPVVVVIEATGGLERALLDALLDAGLPAALVHPGRVRYFAKGLGILSKTDRIDAQTLRRFGQLAEPRLGQLRGGQLRGQCLTLTTQSMSSVDPAC